MATISITVPDPAAPRVLNAVAKAYGYDAARDGTKAEFAKAVVAKFLKEVVAGVEANEAAEAARKTAVENADGISIT